jgi:hypothetical protein
MLRAFFVLTDYDTVSSLCHQTLTVGLASSCILSRQQRRFRFYRNHQQFRRCSCDS